MKDIWETLKTNLGSFIGFLDENGQLIIENEGKQLGVFFIEPKVPGVFLKGQDCLNVTQPKKYEGSWFFAGRCHSRGNAHTPSPLIFRRKSTSSNETCSD